MAHLFEDEAIIHFQVFRSELSYLVLNELNSFASVLYCTETITALVAEGYIQIEKDGNHNFYISSDDGSKLLTSGWIIQA